LDKIIERHRASLHEKIEERRVEMAENNLEHFRLYELLGFSEEEGRKIDLYQNIGRFVYKYAGALLEEATVAVLQHTKEGHRIRIPNTISRNPKNFEIDFFVRGDNKAHEIKWRDATTDGDHVRKEHNKIECMVDAGMIPVRVMYYMPNREQAIRIQERIIAAYREHGEAYVGGEAWDYIHHYTGFDLYAYLYRKAEILAEAVKRGLREPLES
jgi:type II restriction enzyme